MTIQERLQEDLKQAMRERDKARVDVIRNARDALQKAQLEAARQEYEAAARAIHERFADDAKARDEALAHIEADHHQPLDAAAQEAVIAKEVKQRLDAVEMYRTAGHADRAAQEEAEARILETYLPQQMSTDELRPQIAAVIAEHGLSGPAAMGQLMPLLMEQFKGRADGRVLSQIARELLRTS
jgi:uncharacterized protein